MSNSIPVFIKEIFILRIAVISILLREEVQFLPVFNLSCFIKFYASSLSIQLIGQYFLKSFSSKFFSRVCYITYYNYKTALGVLSAFFTYTVFVVERCTFFRSMLLFCIQSRYICRLRRFIKKVDGSINQSIHTIALRVVIIFCKPRYIEIELRFLYTCGMSVTRPIAIGLIRRCIYLHTHIYIYFFFYSRAVQTMRIATTVAHIWCSSGL